MELRRVAPVVGLVALIAADALLIGWAFRPTPTDDYVPVASPTSTSSTTSPRPTASPAPTRKAALAKTVPVEEFITAVGPDIAWVTRAGSCANPDGVWVTRNQGTTWKSNGVPGRVLRLVADSAKAATAVGGDGTCALRLWRSTDSGADWGKPLDASAQWARQPDDSKAVHTPLDQVMRPCGPRDVIDLTVLDDKRAQVLCANGDVRATADGGRRWPRSYTEKRALALTLADSGAGVIVKADPSCQGVVAVPMAAGKPAADGECVVAPTIDGRISVSTAANSWWLLVGEQVFTAEEPIGPWTRTLKDVSG